MRKIYFSQSVVYLLSQTVHALKIGDKRQRLEFASVVKSVTEPKPPKKKRVHRKSDRYRHYDPATGAILNGGPGKPRPSRQLDDDTRKDYQFGGRIPNAIGTYLSAIMQQTGESKTALFSRILKEWLKQQPDKPDISKLE